MPVQSCALRAGLVHYFAHARPFVVAEHDGVFEPEPIPARCDQALPQREPTSGIGDRNDPGMTELHLLLQAIAKDLGDPSNWSAPWSFLTH